jgi:hypothetical protein
VFVTSVIRHEKLVLPIILSCVTCLPMPYFYKLSCKRHDFQKHVVEPITVLLFSLRWLPEIFLILRRTEWDVAIHVHGSSCKAPDTLIRFEWHLKFLAGVWKIHRYHISWKSAQWGCRVVPRGHAERHDEADGRFSQLFKQSNNIYKFIFVGKIATNINLVQKERKLSLILGLGAGIS